MNIDEIHDAPDILMEFLEYHSTVRGHSDQTVAGYYLDLKILFRFLKRRRGPFHLMRSTSATLTLISLKALKSKSSIVTSPFRRKCSAQIARCPPRVAAAVPRPSSHSLIISSRSVICSKPMFVKNLTCLKGSCLCRATSRNPNVSGFCLYAAARMGSATIAY